MNKRLKIEYADSELRLTKDPDGGIVTYADYEKLEKQREKLMIFVKAFKTIVIKVLPKYKTDELDQLIKECEDNVY